MAKKNSKPDNIKEAYQALSGHGFTAKVKNDCMIMYDASTSEGKAAGRLLSEAFEEIESGKDKELEDDIPF